MTVSTSDPLRLTFQQGIILIFFKFNSFLAAIIIRTSDDPDAEQHVFHYKDGFQSCDLLRAQSRHKNMHGACTEWCAKESKSWPRGRCIDGLCRCRSRKPENYEPV